MDYDALSRAVAEDAAFRRRQRLQPVGGQGDKIFPPTYPGEGRNPVPRHVLEKRRVKGEEVWCALVDSVQSQANRLEEALLAAIREGAVVIPHVTVDFRNQGLAGIETITSLDAPHRVYDAILRDSVLEGTKTSFMDSDDGERLKKALPGNAAALLEISPTSLLFGAWYSTGQGGGLGAKFPRALVSEMTAVGVPVDIDGSQETSLQLRGDTVALDWKSNTEGREGFLNVRTAGRRSGSRIDPIGVLSTVPIYQSAADPNNWTAFESKAATKGGGKNAAVLFQRKKSDKAGKPAVINHGNVKPSIDNLGITCEYVDHVAVVSFASLRRLRFGDGEKDRAARAYLAALGLLSLVEADAQGYALRSRCDLVPEGKVPFELVQADGSATDVPFSRVAVRRLYIEALERVKSSGLDLRQEPRRLVPSEDLVEIVRKSQDLALRGKADMEADEDASKTTEG